MCRTCWDEVDRPDHVTPDIERAVTLTKRLYDFHSTGGPLHIATDDWNLDDADLRFCQKEAVKWLPLVRAEEFDEATAVAQELAALLLAMPTVDRYAAMARSEGFV